MLAVSEQELDLLIPDHDAAEPELSIVIPALNEELTIGDFVDWCQAGMARAGIRGEILIVDSSTDRTPQIARAHGARVLRTPKRGLGRAYIEAIPYIRGRYVLMGDADCTYDFRELAEFVRAFRAGYQFVMGSRFRGSIEPSSMPALHQYFGTPVTTGILNLLYATHFSDIHCGMRGVTRQALADMHLESQSWEYASEMVLKSVAMRLRTTEVPVRFLKDREGRTSHMKRSGWMEPWRAGWINLRAMFVNGADFFVLRPGLALFLLGLILTLPLTLGPVRIGAVTFSLYWMLLGLAAAILGLQSFYLGCIAQVLYDYTGEARQRWLRVFPYNRSVLLSAIAITVGSGMAGRLLSEYLSQGLSLAGNLTPWNHVAVTGLLLVVVGFTTFSFTLVLHAAAAHARPQTSRPTN
jgi:glycosyltransferase involved in cell wall biosynthesis